MAQLNFGVPIILRNTLNFETATSILQPHLKCQNHRQDVEVLFVFGLLNMFVVHPDQIGTKNNMPKIKN